MFNWRLKVLGTILVTCSGILNVSQCRAQSPLRAESLTVEDGLSQGYVSCLLEDREGFLWIGTKNGLNRYDGRNFKIFTPNPVDSFSISQNWVVSVKEFGHFLALGFSQGGINLFDKETYHSYSLRVQEEQSQLLSISTMHICHIDEDGNILAHKHTGEQGQLIKISFPGGWPRDARNVEISVKYEIIQTLDGKHSIEINPISGNIWLLNQVSNQLTFKSLKTKEVKNHALPADFPHKDLSSWHVVDDNNIWFTTLKKVIRFNGKDWQSITTDFDVLSISQHPGESLVFIKSNDQLLLFSRDDFRKRNLKSKEAQGYITNVSGLTSAIYKDRSGIYWLGTGGYGVLKFNQNLQYFRQYFPGNSIRSPVFFDLNNLPTLRTSNPIEVDAFLEGNKSLARGIKSIEYAAFDRFNNYWVLALKQNKSLVLLRKMPSGTWEKSGEFEALQGLGSNFFRFDENGNIWFAYAGELMKFDPFNRQMTAYPVGNIIRQNFKIYDLQKTANGCWWIATDYGLVRANPTKAGFDFELLTVIKSNENSLRCNEINSLAIHPANANLLWIGTRGGGLEQLNTTTMTFTHLTSRDGLPNDVIYGILPDEKGNLWLSSNQGIIRYCPASGEIYNYTVADGLLNNEFNTWAFAKAPNGTLYFGGVRGLVGINPNDLFKNPVVPKVRITGLSVNNQYIRYGDAHGILSKTIPFTTHITLPYSQNSINLELAALEFTVPSKNTFKYYLKGAEMPWVHESTDNKATYLNLQPGNYTFLVKACNSDGVWNETPTLLQITILPPWYRTFWAYTVYAILVIIFIYKALGFFLRQQKLKHELALEQNEAERLKELDELKTRFFTNITHEFRTPLTLIQGMADEVIHFQGKSPGKLKSAGRLIKKNGGKLLQMLNQLLDLARLESNALALEQTPTELVGFLRYMVSNYESLGAGRNISIFFYSQKEKIVTLADQDRLGIIISNLLSNAIKFSYPGGKVIVRFQVSENWKDLLEDAHLIALHPSNNDEGKWAIIFINDNGHGIASASLPKIFDRFYQAEPVKKQYLEGTGIGLALVKELVQIMGGLLAVRSEVGIETEFVLGLPLIPAKSAQNKKKIPLPSNEIENVWISEPATAELAAKPPNTNRPVMLLVEDNSDVLAYLISSISNDYQILTAQNGQEGIEKAVKMLPDIIIMDVMMPEMDGFEALKVLKADSRTQNIPIIMLSAWANQKDRLKALKKGADDYLYKPFSSEELRARAANLLRNYQQRTGFKNETDSLGAFFPAAAHQDWLEMLENICLIAIHRKIELHNSYLAEQLSLSERHLLRRLKHLTGMTTKQYILELKLKMAAQLLSDKPHLSISEIAYLCGFNTPNYFAKVFHARFGKRPSEFLEKNSQ